MSAHLASLHVPPRLFVDDEEPAPLPDLATARYVDREITGARTSADLCTVVASRARSQGRNLVAGVLDEFEAEFTDEAALLAPARLPGVSWPSRVMSLVDDGDELDEWIDTVAESLQHSERTLRWIARRPDLPAFAQVTFNALASSRHAQRNLLLACSAIDD
jgi:hypothetical protein